jgi:multidrug resistance protein, MATE family
MLSAPLEAGLMTILPDVPHRAIWRVAVPAMVTAVATAMIGVVDTWAIGQTNDAQQMAGVAIGAMFFAILLFSFNFLRMGTTGLTAQAFGQKDATEQLRILLRAVLFALIISMIILLLTPWVISAGLFALGAELQVHAYAKDYAVIRLWSLPLGMVSMAMVGHLMGVQAMRAVLKIEVIYNLANLLFCILLVRHGDISPEALAWANVAAEAIKFVCLIILVLPRYGRSILRAAGNRVTWQAHALLRLASINRDLFLRTALLMLCLLVMTRTGAQAGATALAANQILFQFFVLSALVLDGFEAAAQTLGGAAVGAQDRQRFQQIALGCMVWAGVTAVVVSLLYAVFGDFLLARFTENPAVLSAAKTLILFAVICPLAGFASFAFDGIYIGAAWTGGMLLTMAIAAGVYLLLIFLLVPQLGMPGLWLAFLALFIVRAAGQALLFPALARQTFLGVNPATESPVTKASA